MESNETYEFKEVAGVGDENPKRWSLISMIREYLNEAGRCPCDVLSIRPAPAMPAEKELEEGAKDTDKAAQE